jgi:hypothetical protein
MMRVLTGAACRIALEKTTMSQSWIAEHLGMKNAANVSRVIHRMDLSRLEEKVLEDLRRFVSEKLKGGLRKGGSTHSHIFHGPPHGDARLRHPLSR